MTPTVTINQRDKLNFEEKLTMLAMPRRKRVRLLKELGRIEIRKTKKRASQQKDVNGRKLASRSKSSGRKDKVLKRMAVGLEPYVFDGNRLNVTWKNKRKGQIAARHHLGQSEMYTAKKAKKLRKDDANDDQCTRAQARKLRELGYKVKRKNGRGWKSPSLNEMQRTLPQGKAGVIIRYLEDVEPKSSWKISLPERQILGSREAEINRELIGLIKRSKTRK